MPFTPNRQFKAKPRLLAKSSGMHYWTPDGRQILDAVAGLWCVNAGHGRKEITEAVAHQLETMDFAPAFQMGHPIAFELANAVKKIAPAGLDHVFFTNSGSEAVDTAMKIALAYHRLKGDSQRTKIISRERAYHGVNLGGTSLGGIGPNRKFWSANLMPGVDYIPHTHDLKRNAFTRGEPEHGVELADELEKLVLFHDPSTIAAVFIEPIAGSTGVLDSAEGLSQAHSRDLHEAQPAADLRRSHHGLRPHGLAVRRAGIRRDAGHHHRREGPHERLRADGLRDRQQDDLRRVHAGAGWHRAVPRLHVQRASRCLRGGPRDARASTSARGCSRARRRVSRYWEDAAHSLKGTPHLIDIRNYGLIAALEFEPIPGKPGARAFEVYLKCFEKGLLVRQTGDIIALSPPLIVERPQIDQIFGMLAEVLKSF